MPERLGEISSSDKGTLYDAFNWILDEIHKSNPNIKIILCTPPNAFLWGGAEPSISNFKTVANAIKVIGAKRDIPVWDMVTRSGITKEKVGKMTGDGIHPTQATTDSLAKDGVKFFLSIKE